MRACQLATGSLLTEQTCAHIFKREEAENGEQGSPGTVGPCISWRGLRVVQHITSRYERRGSLAWDAVQRT